MIKIAVSGAAGRIGRTIYTTLIGSDTYDIVFGVDAFGASDLPYPVYKSFADAELDADVIIDFSAPDALDDMLAYALTRKARLVIATTGYTPAQLEKIKDASKKVPVFKASNMSLGVNLLTALAKDAAKFLDDAYDVEIVETHHNHKLDAPSGTALTIAEAINEVRGNELVPVFGRHEARKRRDKSEIGIHAVRGGTVVGKHEVMFLGSGEVIRLAHESESKELYARGALRAAMFLMDKTEGFYDMTSILGNFHAVTAVSSEKDVALITLPSISFDNFLLLLQKINKHHINLDMISQNYNSDGTAAVSFTLSGKVFRKVEGFIPPELVQKTVLHTCKITAEGAGMEHKSGVALKVLSLLKSKGANVYAITTSETKISCCIDENSLEAAETALKKYYGIK